MSVANKLLQAAAGNVGGPVYVNDVFSTYLYEGNSSTRTITNGIDLAGEGGMIWFKGRNQAYTHQIFDSERNSFGTAIATNDNGKGDVRTNYVTGVNADGFDLGAGAFVNNSTVDFVSWTFRKAPNFFTMVKYTGNGTAGHTISHDLGGTPGCIWIKRIDDGDPWRIWHRGFSDPTTDRMSTFGAVTEVSDSTYWNSTAPTSTNFTLGTNNHVNRNGAEFIAYIFAHHNSDGEFGENEDEDIIKCGVYSGLNSGAEISLGFEPQFLILKRRDATAAPWIMVDTMRNFSSDSDSSYSNDQKIELSTNAAETGLKLGHPTPDGFVIDSTNSDYITSSGEYIYIAIRKNDKPASEFAATELFKVVEQQGGNFVDMGFAPDLFWSKSDASTGPFWWMDTKRGLGLNQIRSDSTSQEDHYSTQYWPRVDMEGLEDDWNSGGTNPAYYGFKEAKGFLDIVIYEGNGTSGRTVNHNLGVKPELLICKRRDANISWVVYNKTTGATKVTELDSNAGSFSGTGYWNDTEPTATNFTVGNSSNTNVSNGDYVAYLFASVEGICKIGTYTGNGTNQNIDCGFSSGARFILLRRTDAAGNWWVFDSVRGIVAGNDPGYQLNRTSAEETGDDAIDPYSAGFNVRESSTVEGNTNGGTYIFMAIA